MTGRRQCGETPWARTTRPRPPGLPTLRHCVDRVLCCTYEWDHLTQEAPSPKVCEKSPSPAKVRSRLCIYHTQEIHTVFWMWRVSDLLNCSFCDNLEQIICAVTFLNFYSLFLDLEAVWVGGKIASMIKKKGVASTPWTQSWGEARCVWWLAVMTEHWRSPNKWKFAKKAIFPCLELHVITYNKAWSHWLV